MAGGVEIVAGLLLIIPATAQAGALESSAIMSAAAATLLRSRDWGRLPAAAALMGASVAAIVIHP